MIQPSSVILPRGVVSDREEAVDRCRMPPAVEAVEGEAVKGEAEVVMTKVAVRPEATEAWAWARRPMT